MRWIFPLLILPMAAQADPSLECSAAGSQVEIGACVVQMEDQVQSALEVAYSIASDAAKELDGVTGRTVAVPALETAQTTWASYRDAQCEDVGALYGGGSGTGIAITSCRVELGRKRVSALLTFAN